MLARRGTVFQDEGVGHMGKKSRYTNKRLPSPMPTGSVSLNSLFLAAAVTSIGCDTETDDSMTDVNGKTDAITSPTGNPSDSEITPPMVMPEQDMQIISPMPPPRQDMAVTVDYLAPMPPPPREDMAVEDEMDFEAPMPPPQPDMMVEPDSEIVAPMPPPRRDMMLETDMEVIAPMPPPMPPPRDDFEDER